MRARSPLNEAALLDRSLSYTRATVLQACGTCLVIVALLGTFLTIGSGSATHPNHDASNTQLLFAAVTIAATLTGLALEVVAWTRMRAATRRRRAWLAGHDEAQASVAGR